MAERVLDCARRREFRDGIRVPRLGRGRIGRRHHRRGRLMLVGRLPRGGRRDGIFRLGTRPGRRRRRRRRRGGSRLRLVLQPGPPGRAGMRRDRRPAPPPRRRPPASHPRRRRPAGGRMGHSTRRSTGPEGCVRGPGKDATVHAAHSASHISPVARRGDPRAALMRPREPRRERSIYYWGARNYLLLPRVSAFFPVLGWTFRRVISWFIAGPV